MLEALNIFLCRGYYTEPIANTREHYSVFPGELCFKRQSLRNIGTRGAPTCRGRFVYAPCRVLVRQGLFFCPKNRAGNLISLCAPEAVGPDRGDLDTNYLSKQQKHLLFDAEGSGKGLYTGHINRIEAGKQA